ncbi:hypothetical protein [Amycolatopsis japonica]
MHSSSCKLPRHLLIGGTALIVLAEVISIVLSLQSFRWAFTPLGPLEGVAGGVVFPLGLHAAAILAIVPRLQGPELQLRNRVLVVIAVLLAAFVTQGAWISPDHDLESVFILTTFGAGGPLTAWLITDSLRSLASDLASQA